MSSNTLLHSIPIIAQMAESSVFSAPFFENASNGLLNYLFQEESVPLDAQLSDPFPSNSMNLENYDTDTFTDMSGVSSQRAGDFSLGQCFIRLDRNHCVVTPACSYGMSYQNRNEATPSFPCPCPYMS